jgi:diguanylate cyclase (GGDEF)-like protein
VRLKPEGLHLQHCLDAEEGVRTAQQIQPDLILCDLEMPGLHGFEVCRRLKEDPTTNTIPIIFLTGADDVVTKVEGFDLGASDYITKPFQPAELRARVRAALRTKRYHDMLALRAQVDALTGLRNRAYFDDRLSYEVRASARYHRNVGLALIDVDHFKSVNDRHGHPAGDYVLQMLGALLIRTVRAADSACRYGGEEFAVILTETDLEGTRTLGERFRREVENMTWPTGNRVTVSVGVAATSMLLQPTTEMLIAAADDALYDAKLAGRNCVCKARPTSASRSLAAK